MSDQLVLVESSAQFSLCGRYRYTLTRRFAEGAAVLFVGLNPSTADAQTDDPTIRRCLGFAKRWGYGMLLMGNLYGWRATDPRELVDVPCPISSAAASDEHDKHLMRLAIAAKLIVVAWGANPGPVADRPAAVIELLRRHGPPGHIYALGTTKHGLPRHPLYLRADAEPIPYPTEAT